MTLQATATKMAQHVMEKANIPQQRKAIFVYGCELTLSTSASVLSIILLSIVLGALYSSFVFLAVFMGIRFFAGGYHAKTYSHCFLLTNFIYIISFLLSKYVLAPLSWPVKLILLLSSAIVVLVFAPIRHKKHPLSEQTYRKNAIIGRAITVLISLGAILLLLKDITTQISTLIVVTLMAIAIMMILPKIKEGVE